MIRTQEGKITRVSLHGATKEDYTFNECKILKILSFVEDHLKLLLNGLMRRHQHTIRL